MRFFAGTILCLATACGAWAGPVDFGKQEFDRAVAERKLSRQLSRIQTEISADPPESFRILGVRISGGSPTRFAGTTDSEGISVNSSVLTLASLGTREELRGDPFSMRGEPGPTDGPGSVKLQRRTLGGGVVRS